VPVPLIVLCGEFIHPAQLNITVLTEDIPARIETSSLLEMHNAHGTIPVLNSTEVFYPYAQLEGKVTHYVAKAAFISSQKPVLRSRPFGWSRSPEIKKLQPKERSGRRPEGRRLEG